MLVSQSLSSSDWFSQKSHALEMKALRIVMNENGVTRSQARKALQQAATNEINRRNEEARNRPQPLIAPPPAPQIQRTEQVLPPIKQVLGNDTPPVVPGPPASTESGGIEECPAEDDRIFGRTRGSGDDVGAWSFAVPEAPTGGHIYARQGEAWLDVGDSLIVSADADASTTGPDDPAAATAVLTDGNMHFEFVIPRGFDGEKGDKGDSPTTEELTDLIEGLDLTAYALNPITVALLSMTVSNPPTQAEMQTVADKIDELITALKH